MLSLMAVSELYPVAICIDISSKLGFIKWGLEELLKLAGMKSHE